MTPITRTWRNDWPHSAMPSSSNARTYVQRYGRRRTASGSALPTQLNDFHALTQSRSSQATTLPGKEELDSRLELQCPACRLRAQMNDYEVVYIGSDPHFHCPGCDANLGLPERALKHAA